MASRQQLEDALIKAHEAGDAEAAQLFATEIKGLSTKPSTRDTSPKNPIDRWIVEKFHPQLSRAPDIQASIPGRVIQGAADLPVGAMQLAGNVIGLGGPVNQRLQQIEQTTQELRGPDAGFDWARLAGNLANPIPWKAGGMLPRAATATGRIGQSAALGAATGASTPLYEDDFWTNKGIQTGAGAVIGGVLGGAVEGGAAGYRFGRNLFDQFFPGGHQRAAGRVALDALGPRAPEAIKLMENPKQYLPGAMPTAAEAAAPAGSAEFSGLQAVVEKAKPTAYDQIAKSQQHIRQLAIQSIGKDKPALESAIKSRGSAARTEYGEAYKQAIKGDPELMTLSEDPYFKRALPAALDLMKSKGLDLKTNLTQFLHFVKLGLDDQLGGTAREAISTSEKAAVQGVKERLVGWIGKKNPLYETARENFAAASKPIDQMKVGQELEKALISPLGVSERPGVFASAVENAPRTIKKATGQPRYEKLEEVLTPDQVGLVGAVKSDLSRAAESDRLGRIGSQRARELIGEQAPELPSAGMLERTYTVLRAVSSRLHGKLEKKSIDALADAMQDPQRMASLLKSVSPSQRAVILKALVDEKLLPPSVMIGSMEAARGVE